MNAYILILIADILLATNFVFQKKYQKTAGVSLKAGVTYNAVLGAFSAIIFLVINKFHIECSAFSLLMAAIFATVLVLYIIIGFKIMEKGNMSLYTLFLMSGGMTVPYIWGVLFLNEELTIIRTIGLLAIIAAIIISNSGTNKPDKKQILMCVAVFLLNGISSVVSKMHQINPVSEMVTPTNFVFLVGIFKAIMCFGILLGFKNKLEVQGENKLDIKPLLLIIFLAALTDGVTYMLQLIGASSLPATVLYPFVTGGSIILTSIAGVLVFKEKLLPRQIIGIAVCFVGTLLFL